MILTPIMEIKVRIQNLQEELAATEYDGAIILLNSDMYYLTGTAQNAHLFVPVRGEAVMAVHRSLIRAREESPLKNIVPLKSLKDFPSILADFGYSSFTKLGMELDALPVNNLAAYQRLFPQTRIVDVSPLVRKIRMIKSPFEVELMRETLRVIDKAFREVPKVLHEGMLEVELASFLESTLRCEGAVNSKMRAFNQEIFLGTICSGDSGAKPSMANGSLGGFGLSPAFPQGPSHKAIKRNEAISIDYTIAVNGYIGDQTRIFCIGELEPKMRKAYEDALFINNEVLKSLKPGTPAEEGYFIAVRIAEELGYNENFLGYKENQTRFVGHGVGLEVDEMPILAPGQKTLLLPGMTFALEPKIVFPEGAVGTENTFVMTENGPENLSITPQNITYLND